MEQGDGRKKGKMTEPVYQRNSSVLNAMVLTALVHQRNLLTQSWALCTLQHKISFLSLPRQLHVIPWLFAWLA